MASDQTPSPTPSGARVVMSSGDVSRALRRVAHEILERNKGPADLVLLGIPSRGVPLAHRLAAVIAEVEGVSVPVGSLDVTMHRDDLRLWVPKLAATTIRERADLPGVSASRAAQLLAGAVVAEAAMDLLDVPVLQICPWALREGVILEKLDALPE